MFLVTAPSFATQTLNCETSANMTTSWQESDQISYKIEVDGQVVSSVAIRFANNKKRDVNAVSPKPLKDGNSISVIVADGMDLVHEIRLTGDGVQTTIFEDGIYVGSESLSCK